MRLITFFAEGSVSNSIKVSQGDVVYVIAEPQTPSSSISAEFEAFGDKGRFLLLKKLTRLKLRYDDYYMDCYWSWRWNYLHSSCYHTCDMLILNKQENCKKRGESV